MIAELNSKICRFDVLIDSKYEFKCFRGTLKTKSGREVKLVMRRTMLNDIFEIKAFPNLETCSDLLLINWEFGYHSLTADPESWLKKIG